ncbi:uncharacterized protein LOC133039117 [Cannabis sativa]|uniref:uncharacterized protein LOC133039117 n=1 Tax=Cannabis sativa TaxID=3483 RepID=UPI0029C9DD33|nr:uncharacterized protein LOC133039117 [Cannabis sativa]
MYQLIWSSVSAISSLGGDYTSWFESLLQFDTAQGCEEAVTVCWAIWNARNALTWKGKSSSASKVVLSARVNFNQWKTAQSKKNGPLFILTGANEGREQWSKPVSNKIKVNVDGAIFASEGWYAAGGVARDCHGHLVEAFFISKPGCLEATEVEAFGIKEALSWIKGKNWEV